MEAKLKKRTTTTSTRINVREALTRAQNKLTHEEERLLRMRAAVSHSGALELTGQEFDHTRALLAMIEQEALEAMREAQPAQKQSTGEAAAKAAIIASLRGDN